MRYLLLCLLFIAQLAFSFERGIYVTSSTLLHTRAITHLINQAKKYNINTFVIDFYHSSSRYRKNIQLVKNAGITYVARIVVFPGGAKTSQVKSQRYLEKINNRIKGAASMGANQIQLDYIRYDKSRRGSRQNVNDIHQVIKYFAKTTDALKLPLQIAVFGEVSYIPSLHIGQDVKTFAYTVDVVAPMVYPSHYTPYRYHSQNPYKTIYHSLTEMKKQFNGKPPFKIYAYIEMFNIRYPMSSAAKMKYINEEIKAVRDAGVNGWYAWSANNKYWILFQTLQKYR